MTASMIQSRKSEMSATSNIAMGCKLRSMSHDLPPMTSAFATDKEAEAYERWLRGKVRASMQDGRQGIAHDDVMAEVESIIRAAEAGLAANRS
ncbi:type II toxin-antitoxin system RelB family antitoxin [Trinickia dabaoshanensis]